MQEVDVDKPDDIRVRVVPVSTIPAVLERIGVDAPYLIDWSIPQNCSAGTVVVRDLVKSR